MEKNENIGNLELISAQIHALLYAMQDDVEDAANSIEAAERACALHYLALDLAEKQRELVSEQLYKKGR